MNRSSQLSSFYSPISTTLCTLLVTSGKFIVIIVLSIEVTNRESEQNQVHKNMINN